MTEIELIGRSLISASSDFRVFRIEVCSRKPRTKFSAVSMGRSDYIRGQKLKQVALISESEFKEYSASPL